MAPAWAVPALTAAAWALRAAVWACLAASAMLVAEAAYMGLASLVAVAAAAAAMLWRWRRPDARYRWEPMPGAGGRDDVEAADFPMVLVQIPMYNEREVRRALLFCVPPLIAGLLHVAVA
jgi:beta-mannan synthase